MREVFGHLLDAERVFGYRALGDRARRNPAAARLRREVVLEISGYDRWPVASLLSEFDQVRESHVAMFRRFDETAWERVGVAAGHPVSARALAYIMAGHVRHHLGVLVERYAIAHVS